MFLRMERKLTCGLSSSGRIEKTEVGFFVPHCEWLMDASAAVEWKRGARCDGSIPERSRRLYGRALPQSFDNNGLYRLRLFGHAFAAQAASFISWS
jgi:hypothetical protein